MAFKFSHREINRVTGNVETWYYDPDLEKFQIKTTHDVGGILRDNQRQAAASLDQRFGNQMMHHVAEIPNGVITKLRREEGIDVFSLDPDQLRKLRRTLDDPEYKYLKTTVKKLSRTSGSLNGL